MVLEKIQKENDIKKLTPEELELLKDEIRQQVCLVDVETAREIMRKQTQMHRIMQIPQK